jgi:hypothetical protein
LAAALLFALWFAARGMAPALGPDRVQDDARNYVFWMARFRDPELFRDGLIADYFESVTPPGYAAVYRALSWAVDPLLASKLLPPILGLTTALFIFLLVRKLHPSPAGAFLAAVLLSWYVWQLDDISSAGPRAFLPPLLAAQLWSLVAGRLVLAVGLVVAAALFYPMAGALGVALLGTRLLIFRGRRPALLKDPSAKLAFVAGAALVALLLLPGQLGSSRFGPVISGAQARVSPQFGPDGRQPFFVENAYDFWIDREHSGLDLRARDALFPRVPILFEYLALAVLLPLLLLFGRRLPGVRRLSGETIILPQLLAASFGLFFLAHVLLFHLYHPNRYVKQSLPLALAVAGGLALGILVEAISDRVGAAHRGPLRVGLALCIGLAVAVYPADFHTGFERDEHPSITAYLRAQPKDTLVVGMPSETDVVPTFASRRVLVNGEYLLPFHLGYSGELHRRTEDLIEAYYAESAEQIAEFVGRYGVDVMLVNRAAFERATFKRAWNLLTSLSWEPWTTTVARKLERSSHFALLELASRCAVLEDRGVAVVPTVCLAGEP